MEKDLRQRDGLAMIDDPQKFLVGDRVEKWTGDYTIAGEVRAVFTNRAGKTRYVVEHEIPGCVGGILHIYGPQNLRALPDMGEADG